MKLLPLDSRELFELAAGWLQRRENSQWLDFGIGHHPVTPALLMIMARRDTHFLRLYTSDRDDTLTGLVGLSNVDRVFKTAVFWGVSGDKSFRNRGYSTLASSKLMTFAFGELGLRSVNAWAVEGNPSIRVIERLGFRYAGRLRQCHEIDGQLRDRLLFDLLASEHRELDRKTWRLFDRTRREADCDALQEA
ncbi:MAG: GNAT family protein [Betaproteobacteria bacterium]|nr:GNAT family protein [Betaproteobacteria bacterium]